MVLGPELVLSTNFKLVFKIIPTVQKGLKQKINNAPCHFSVLLLRGLSGYLLCEGAQSVSGCVHPQSRDALCPWLCFSLFTDVS